MAWSPSVQWLERCSLVPPSRRRSGHAGCRVPQRGLVDVAGELGDAAAAAHDDDAVAEPHQLRQLARGDEDAEAVIGKSAQALVDLDLGADVDAARGFVEQEKLRTA